MFSTLRNRFGIPGVISVIALVFAMIGGAYAASNGDSGKSATASAKKSTKGPRGPKGAKGATGAAGPAGPAGPAGAKGDAGANGANGADGAKGATGTNGQSVTVATEPPDANCGEQEGLELTSASGTAYVCNGAEGAKGAKGDPWTAGGILPKGATQTGAWNFSAAQADEHPIAKLAFTTVSFSIPVEPPPTPHYSSEASFGTTCTGTAHNPTAPSGHLCVYESGLATGVTFVAITGFDFVSPSSRAGAILGFDVTSDDPGSALGSYAVTG